MDGCKGVGGKIRRKRIQKVSNRDREVMRRAWGRIKLSKRIKNIINVRPKTIQLLEENTRSKLYGIGFGNDFLAMTPKARRK